MSKTFKLAGLLVAVAFLSLTSGTASAGILNFGFTNSGYLSDLDTCGGGCLHLETTGHVEELGGLGEWSFKGVMEFYQGSGEGIGYGAGTGLGWSFKDLDGNNSLFGSFTNIMDGGLLDFSRVGEVSYTILGGSGLFDGAKGFGSSTIVTSLFGLLFDEVGTMSVVTQPANVPEPGMTSLLLAGLGMMGVLAYRRRRLQVKL